MKKIKTRVPEYLKTFKCIGGVCTDNCCMGWMVDIDKDTFKKYKKIQDPELKKIIDNKISRNKEDMIEEIDFAKVTLTKHKNCPFLDDDHLCKMQIKHGEEYLSNVCHTFPRVTNVINGVYESSATMSCPEIAKMALLNKDGIKFIEEEVTPDRYIIADKLNLKSPDFKHHPIKHLLIVREFCIDVVRCREFTFYERLLILEEFIGNFEDIAADMGRDVDDIVVLVKEYKEKLKNKSFVFCKKDYSLDDKEYDQRIQILKILLDKLDVFNQVDSKRFISLTTDVLKGLGFAEEKKYEEITKKYKDAKAKIVDPYFKDREYILENFLVNYMFHNMFPFSVMYTAYDNFIMLVTRLALIEFSLVGLSAVHGELTDEMVVEYIQVFSKVVEHHGSYTMDAADFIIEMDYNNRQMVKTLSI